MNKIMRKVELLASISMIIGLVSVGAVLIKNYLTKNTAQKADPTIAVGNKISVPETDFVSSGKTLLLTLQVGCHFCEASVPFYQRLLKEIEGRQDIHVVAVLPQDSDSSQQYLANMGIKIREVKQAPLKSIGVAGTPTIILVDNTGTIIDFWVGKLPPDKEDEVLNRLRL